jgi:putative FmdB family regulatory protein
MPLYEYRCDRGHTFEVIQRMSDDPITTCETCEAPVQRVFHPVAVHFKGSGFYTTDYGRGKRSGPSDDSAPSDSGAKKADEKKKPEKSGSGSGKSDSAD